MTSLSLYVAVFFAVATVVVTLNEDCIGAGVDDNGVNCTFYRSYCGWRNLKDYDVNWIRYRTRNEGDYLLANMNGASTGDTAGLTSKLICSTDDKMFRLKFNYYLQSSGNCKLSVSVNVNGTKREVWKTLQASDPEEATHWATRQTDISSPGAPFQIIFEATRLTRLPCGDSYNEIDLDEISFAHVGFLPTTTTTAPSTAASTTSLSTDPHTSSDYTTDLPPATTNQTFRNETTRPMTAGSHSDTNIGVAVGVTLAVVVLVAVIMVIVIVLRRNGSAFCRGGPVPCLKKEPKKQPEARMDKLRRAVSNDMYTSINTMCRPTDQFVITGTLHPATDMTHEFHYELSDRPEFTNLYSDPDDPNFFQPSTATAHVDTHDVHDTDSGKHAISRQDSYNKLSFKPSDPLPQDARPTHAYDHLNNNSDVDSHVTESSEYSLPRGDTEVQSRGGFRSEHAERPVYENVVSIGERDGGRVRVSGEYNHLDLQGEGRTAGEAVDKRNFDTYHHLA